MTDTQWPRYMVFQQHTQSDQFVHNGTVHAPDREMALLNARDVFARRPEAVAMWVVPADGIFSKTEEELTDGLWLASLEPSDDSVCDFHVFGKLTHINPFDHLGIVRAATAELAMQAAIETYTDQPVFTWWVFKADSVLSTEAEDEYSHFRPFNEHEFKNQAHYPVITMMREIKRKGKLED